MKQSSSRRIRLLKRIFIYFVMTSAVVFASTVLVFLLLGYRFNKDIGTFQQGGLVQFDTQPDNARVTVGRAQLANRTPSKITLNPGQYLVKMELDGYNSWQKNVTVEAGVVLWLNSASFVPSQPETGAVLSLPKLSSMASRVDGERVALLPEATSPKIVLVDIDGDEIETENLTLPTSSFTAAKKHSFTLENWATNDRYLLARHTFDKKSEWLVIDTDDVTKSRIISNQTDNAVRLVRFDPSSANTIYAQYADNSIRRMSIDRGELSPVLVQNVADFSLTSSGTLLFSTVPTDGVASIGYLTRGQSITREIESVKSTAPIQIAGSQYFNKFYLAHSAEKLTTIDVFDNLPSSNSNTPLQSKDISSKGGTRVPIELDFKAGGRLLAVQYPRLQHVYDTDPDIWSTVPLAGLKKDLKSPVQWVDGMHFWNDDSGFMRQYEFDGTNQASITEVAQGFEAVYSPNSKYLYTIGKVEKGFVLQRTLMVLEN